MEKYDSDVIRLFMISGHYRTPINFSIESLESSKAGMDRLYNSIVNLENLLQETNEQKLTEEENNYINNLNVYKEKYMEKMDDDFNTADAVSVIFDLVRDINTNLNSNSSMELIEHCLQTIKELGKPLGILQKSKKMNLEQEIEKLIEKRQQARRDKDWALSDKIRDDLKAQGIILEDTPQGVRWKKA